MAFRTKKISQMDPKGSNLASTDLLEISELVSGSYVTKSITGAEIIASVPPTSVEWGDIGGTLSAQTDLDTALNAKQDDIILTTTGTSGASTFVANTLNVPTYSLIGLGGVPTTRTLTINGTTQDLSADRTFTVSTGITIGTTAITSGTVGRVLFEGTGNVVQESANLFWDNTNGRLGIGTSSPASPLHIQSSTNANLYAYVKNTNAGSQSTAGYIVEGTTASGHLFASPSGYNPYSVLGGSQLNIYTTNTFAIMIDAANTTFKIGVGSAGPERMRIVGNTGNVLINTTTDAGYKLDINGTARVSGALTLGTGTAVASSISYNATYGLTMYGSTGSNSDLLLTDRSGNLRFRIVNGGNNLQSVTTINDVIIGGSSFTAKSIYTNGVYGLVLGGSAGSTFNFSLVESTGNNGMFIDSSGNTKIGGISSTYNSSAILEAVSTTKGFLPPRMTTTQKNAIATPTAGLVVYDSTLNKLCVRGASAWETITSL